MRTRSAFRSQLSIAHLLIIGGVVCSPRAASADDVALRNQYHQAVIVHSGDGSYEIRDESARRTLIHSRIAAEIDHTWVTSSDYPQHSIDQSTFEDALGMGHQVCVKFTGLSRPDLTYSIRLYDTIAAGDIKVEVQNHTAKLSTIQIIRSVDAIGKQAIETGTSEESDRVLSDSFSEDWPPLQIHDLGQAPQGMLRAVGSQLIYNRNSTESIFFGALTSERFLTIMHLSVHSDARQPEVASYTVDSTGTTEIQASDPESGLKKAPAKNIIELSLPIAAGATISSERLMFAVGSDYHSILSNYGIAIRLLHHSRISTSNLLGWWSWTAFYSDITEGNTWTNAQWLSEHLKKLGYDYFHLDLGYAYARGEYATPNGAKFPQGLVPFTKRICKLGLNMGFWTAPFEVSDRAWVYENHKDWLVHNAQGEPITIGQGNEDGKEMLFVLDTTNPAAQQYLRKTYETLAKDWGAQYVKLDFMDNTAIEGYYYRPNTTALEAQSIGLRIIREAVGEHVLLDKDGSPMLNPVGIVDEGRLSQDTGHTFLRSKEAAPGIAARYYMHRNFFISDPDALTISRQMIEERHIQAPLTLDEAEVSIALAAVSGGMFEIGDDLPTLGADPDRVALVTNPDLLQMAKLGRAAFPVDLLTYRAEDEQPSIFLLQEAKRQTMLAVFNWTDTASSHVFSLSDLGLSPNHQYRVVDVFRPEEHLSIGGEMLKINKQVSHSVKLIKIIDDSIPPVAPSINASVPGKGKAGEDLRFSAVEAKESVPALGYRWDFGDGTSSNGATVTHTYTRDGTYRAQLTVEGVDGISQSSYSVYINGDIPAPAARRYITKASE
jgi:alpha-galactosidase